MTCIVAVETQDGDAVIAGDFLGSNGFTKNLTSQAKIFEHSSMLFGYYIKFH